MWHVCNVFCFAPKLAKLKPLQGFGSSSHSAALTPPKSTEARDHRQTVRDKSSSRGMHRHISAFEEGQFADCILAILLVKIWGGETASRRTAKLCLNNSTWPGSKMWNHQPETNQKWIILQNVQNIHKSSANPGIKDKFRPNIQVNAVVRLNNRSFRKHDLFPQRNL